MFEILQQVKMLNGSEVIITGYELPNNNKEEIKYYFQYVGNCAMNGMAYESKFYTKDSPYNNYKIKDTEIISESKCLNLTIDLWNEFTKLPSQHPDELTDFKNSIHQLQYILMAREARRNNPNIYNIILQEEK